MIWSGVLSFCSTLCESCISLCLFQALAVCAVELDVLVLFNHDEGDCLIDRLTLCEQHFQAYDCAQFFVISIWVLLKLTQEVLPSMCLFWSFSLQSHMYV